MKDVSQLFKTLRERLRQADRFDLGQFQIINLDLIKARAGDRWSQMRNRVFEVSEHFIGQRLRADDVLVRCEEGFLIVFGSGCAEGAQTRTQAISDALNAFYLGDEFFKRLNIRSSAVRLDPGALVEFLQSSGAQKTCETNRDAGMRSEPGWAVEAIDTTAAGDTFCGVLAARLAEGVPAPEALRHANAAGALATTRHGAQPSIPHRDQIAERLAGSA